MSDSKAAGSARELIPGFEPENELERRLASDPVLFDGLAWGKPRSGHPEGSVGAHVGELLSTLDSWGERGARRAELRFIALVHDALKSQVEERLPRVGENHHAMRARRLAERYTNDERLLAAIELHDRPYRIWKSSRRSPEAKRRALHRMLERVPDRDLFLRFVELDGSAEAKDPRPIEWLRRELEAARGT